MNAETGDERYYEFIGKNSVYPISEIVYPEQREMFLDAFYKAQKGIEDSFLYIKLCDEAGDYYDFLMQLSHNEALVNDVPTVNMTIYEYAPAIIHYEELQKYVKNIEDICRFHRTDIMSMAGHRFAHDLSIRKPEKCHAGKRNFGFLGKESDRDQWAYRKRQERGRKVCPYASFRSQRFYGGIYDSGILGTECYDSGDDQ